jgi:hypothetical protein
LAEKSVRKKNNPAGERPSMQQAQITDANDIGQQASKKQQQASTQEQQTSSSTSQEKSVRGADSVAGKRVAMDQMQMTDPNGAGQRVSTQQQVLSFIPVEKSDRVHDSVAGEHVAMQQPKASDANGAEQRIPKQQQPVLSSASEGKPVPVTDSTTVERVGTQPRASEDRLSTDASATPVAQRLSGAAHDQKKEDTIIQQVPSEERSREAVSPSPSASDENPILAHQSGRSGDVSLNSGDGEPRVRPGEPSSREPVSGLEREATLMPDTASHNQSSGSKRNTAAQRGTYGSNQPVAYQRAEQGDSLAATHPMVDSVSEKPVAMNEDNENQDKEEPEENEKTFYRLSISLAVAPDFSMIGLDRYTTPGESAGLVLQYHFSKKVSLGAGVLRSTKKYWGYGSEYNCPPGYWKNATNGIIPETIDGVCTVLEFPLMVRYNLAGSGKYTVFVSAGASSYVLLDESYRYTFESTNPGAKEGWSSSRNEKYFLNMGQISAGYERFIRPNFAVGIEPYFKIPFTGMGWTDISLYSTGAYVTLRYRFLKTRAGMKE